MKLFLALNSVNIAPMGGCWKELSRKVASMKIYLAGSNGRRWCLTRQLAGGG